MTKLFVPALGALSCILASSISSAAPAIERTNPKVIVGLKSVHGSGFGSGELSLHCPNTELIQMLMAKIRSLPPKFADTVGVMPSQGSVELRIEVQVPGVYGQGTVSSSALIASVQAGAGCAIIDFGTPAN